MRFLLQPSIPYCAVVEYNAIHDMVFSMSLSTGDATAGTVEPKPVERQVEARPVDDSQGSMVRCVYFARTYIVSVQHTTPTMWAGTNNGTVYVFTLSIPQSAKRKDDGVQCQLG